MSGQLHILPALPLNKEPPPSTHWKVNDVSSKSLYMFQNIILILFLQWAGHDLVSIMIGSGLYKIPLLCNDDHISLYNILTQLYAQEDLIAFVYLWQLQILKP